MYAENGPAERDSTAAGSGRPAGPGAAGRRAAAGRGRALAAAVAATALTALVGGCTGRLPAPRRAEARATAEAAGGTAPGSTPTASAAVWARWGLAPLPPAPPPPADKPIKLSRTGPVPVIMRVPTRQRVVFITLDDGQVKDPAFVRMEQQLRVPITMFLMNDAIRRDYGYFRQLQALGGRIENHTLHHPVLTTLPLAGQKAEICGDQRVLTREYGTAPELFRPPYGAYDATTKAAVRACGPGAIVWWKETMQVTNVAYQTMAKKFHDGDIILAHFRGPEQLRGETMTRMFAWLLRRIEQQGFAVARLEDYIRPPTG